MFARLEKREKTAVKLFILVVLIRELKRSYRILVRFVLVKRADVFLDIGWHFAD